MATKFFPSKLTPVEVVLLATGVRQQVTAVACHQTCPRFQLAADHEYRISLALTRCGPFLAARVVVIAPKRPWNLLDVLIHARWLLTRRRIVPHVDPFWGAPLDALDDRTGGVHGSPLQLPRGLDGVEQHGIALLGFSCQVMAGALRELGPIDAIRGGDIWEHRLTPLFHVIEVHEHGGVPVAAVFHALGVEEKVEMAGIFLFFLVPQDLEAFAIAHREEGPPGDAALDVGDDGVVPSFEEHSVGSADVGDLGVAVFGSHDPGAGQLGLSQRDEMITFFGGQEVVEHEDPGVLIEDFHAGAEGRAGLVGV